MLVLEKMTDGVALQNVTSMISTCVKNATIGKNVNITEVKK
jgi:hypothetical protein